MKRIDRVKELLRLARALDYEKDPNPKNWKTINGAKVHLDKNGKYDGGAGGKFNGEYHFGGKNWKQKSASSGKVAAMEMKMENPKAKSRQELEERIEKTKDYSEWNRARGELYRRFYEEETELIKKFNHAGNSIDKHQIGEELDECRKNLKRFGSEAKVPYKVMKALFEEYPETAKKCYEERKFRHEEMYSAYEKWIENKKHTSSILKNLSKTKKK